MEVTTYKEVKLKNATFEELMKELEKGNIVTFIYDQVIMDTLYPLMAPEYQEAYPSHRETMTEILHEDGHVDIEFHIWEYDKISNRTVIVHDYNIKSIYQNSDYDRIVEGYKYRLTTHNNKTYHFDSITD